jgi:uncharacterized membrane protein
MTRLNKKTIRTIINDSYEVGIFIKGLDGIIETALGIWLIISPKSIASILDKVSVFFLNNNRVSQFISLYIARADNYLVKSSSLFIASYLIIHGIVKVCLVYFLIRKIHKAYPPAIGILSLFLVYQVYETIKHPNIWLILLTLLDAIIIWLVYKEYQQIRTKKDMQ